MPAKKQRAGEDLAKWEAERQRRIARNAETKKRVRENPFVATMLPIEVAQALNTSVKHISELERNGSFPPRVTISEQLYVYRLADYLQFLEDRQRGQQLATAG